jgi:hypothetical protein
MVVESQNSSKETRRFWIWFILNFSKSNLDQFSKYFGQAGLAAAGW